MQLQASSRYRLTESSRAPAPAWHARPALSRGPAACRATPTDSERASADPTPPPPASGPRPSLADPVQTIAWGGTLPSGRRLVLGGLSCVGIALGGNLGGVTSALLGLDGGEAAGRLRADVLVPVRGHKRCYDEGLGFEFVYPAYWLADQTIARRRAQRAEDSRGGLPGRDWDLGPGRDWEDDLPPLGPRRAPAAGPGPADGGAATLRRRAAAVEPVAAFGPPGTTGEENVSVVVAPILPGFSLRGTMGAPREAAERLLASLAPPGSGLQPTLIAAEARSEPRAAARRLPGPDGVPPPRLQEGEDGGGEQLYYTLEYTMRGPKFYRHNVSVYTARSGLLYTFNAQCPQDRFEEDAAALRESAASFRLV
ncbi:hypothetical protein HYH03_014194 [Edaphochlamys debaryana]|uniref:PsbP C-terminal domain-containing protein n=1 Tax=Edaphochlamys debaryana TaxID=47281 RepID=A0A835XS30_9CHLO|nr:hypothetical protein HYH03_014194 [Edaphochlamys debaryana]|eukprot:KAG2487221.1 hypothetical protein HYH03_014194 [Edaphochlamys debaryana]